MSNHTPGPWYVNSEHNIRNKNARIATAKLMNSVEETTANALLMAAAPDLLEAAEDTLKYFSREYVENTEICLCYEMPLDERPCPCCRLRAAIGKAIVK